MNRGPRYPSVAYFRVQKGTHKQWHLYHNLFVRNTTVHYDDVTMSLMASQITSLTIVYSTVYSGANQRKHQSSASLAFVRGIHRGPVNSPHKWPVTRKMFPFDDVIMIITNRTCFGLLMSSLRSLDVRLKLPCSYLWQLVWIKTQPGQNGFIWSEKKFIHYIYICICIIHIHKHEPQLGCICICTPICIYI